MSEVNYKETTYVWNPGLSKEFITSISFTASSSFMLLFDKFRATKYESLGPFKFFIKPSAPFVPIPFCLRLRCVSLVLFWISFCNEYSPDITKISFC